MEKRIELNVWYRIPGYNGYEIQFTPVRMHERAYPIILIPEGLPCWFMVRSWKNYKKYPYGYLLPYEHFEKRGHKSYYYEFTDLCNKRNRLNIGTIIDMIHTCDYDNTISAGIQNKGSRNIIVKETEKATISLGSVMSSLIKEQ